MQKLLALLKAYEQVLLLDLNDTTSLRTPYQAFGLLLNLVLATSAFFATNSIGGSVNSGQACITAFIAIVAWTIFTRIIYTGNDWRVLLSLHLNLVTFWVSVTIFFMFVASWWFEYLEINEKFSSVLVLLCIFIPVHMYRSRLALKNKLLYIVLLLFTNSIFAYAAFYK